MVKNKTLSVILLIGFIIFPYFFSQSQVRVKGYYRKDGTYVQPHYRSNPDGNVYNNYSTKGNINPYTGKEGTKNPTASNLYSAKSSYGSSATYSNSNSSTYKYAATHYPINPPYDLYDKKIYYYDNNWKGVANESEASYYRVAYFSKNSKYGSYCIDYYISGEIQGESGFKKIDPKDDKKSIFNGDMYSYEKSGELNFQAVFDDGVLISAQRLNETNKADTYQSNASDNNSYQPKTNNGISISYFEKYGSNFEEEFSIKNNSGKDISSISIRFIYKLENGEIIDYKDYILQETIPNGLSKKFTKKSFDQSQKFVYKYGNGYKGLYTLFTIEYQILNFK